MVKSAHVRAAAILGTVVLATGCGSSIGRQPEADSRATGGSAANHTAGASMQGMDMGGRDHPSKPASMICSGEIQDAVRRTFALSSPPTRSDRWSTATRVYDCTYRVPAGTLSLSVHDSVNPSEGAAYFADLRSQLPHARAIRGIENFGFPAVSSPSGHVAFLKDGKTLQVDASSLSKAMLPRGYTRAEAAYSVASAVIACWTG